MQLKTLRLDNFCQHRRLEHTFHPGVNGILGPNGSGKSNVLKALAGAVTGEFRSDGKNKEDFVSQYAEKGQRSRVMLTLTHHGHEVEIIRGLAGCKSQFRLDSGEVVLGDQKVNQALRDLFGVEPQLLWEYVFVGQGEMFNFISQQSAVRKKALHKLFGLEATQTIWSLLGDEAAVVPAPQLGEDPLDVRNELQATRANVLELRRQYSAVQAFATYDPAQDPELEPLRRFLQQEAAAHTLTEQQALRTAAVQERTLAESELRRITARVAVVAAQVESATAAHAQAEAAQTIADAVARHQAMAAKLQTRRQAMERERELAQAPAAPPEVAQYTRATLREQRLVVVNEITWRERFLKTFDTGVLECPTCHTPVGSLKLDVGQVRAELASYQAQRDELDRIRQVLDDYFEAAGQHEEWQSGFARRWEELLADTETLAEPPQTGRRPAVELDVPKAALALKQARKEQQELEADRQQCQRRLSTQEANQAAAEAAIGKAQQCLQDRVTVEQSRQLQALRATRIEHRDTAQRLAGQLQACERLLPQLAARLATAKQAKQQRRQVAEYREHLTALRVLFHHDQLPKAMAQTELERLEQDLNDRLQEFDAEFRVEAADDLSFTIHFLDGVRVQPMTWLSFGQRVLLALALRISINARYIGDVGLLTLDEPTDSLDAANIRCLEPALGRLRHLSSSRGLQCVIVTHEKQLHGLFDQVLTLRGTREANYAPAT